MHFFIVKVHLTPKKIFAELMKLIVWRNLPQKFLDLVKSSIFCAQSKPDGSRPRMGNQGKLKIATSNRERTLYLCMSHILNRTNARDIFQLNSVAGSAQYTDLYFYKQCLLLHRIPKWVMTQKTLKLIILLK